jgi:hypothetical protein
VRGSPRPIVGASTRLGTAEQNMKRTSGSVGRSTRSSMNWTPAAHACSSKAELRNNAPRTVFGKKVQCTEVMLRHFLDGLNWYHPRSRGSALMLNLTGTARIIRHEDSQVNLEHLSNGSSPVRDSIFSGLYKTSQGHRQDILPPWLSWCIPDKSIAPVRLD